jgi:hypothetical protein
MADHSLAHGNSGQPARDPPDWPKPGGEGEHGLVDIALMITHQEASALFSSPGQ